MTVSELKQWIDSEDASFFHMNINSPALRNLILDWQAMRAALVRAEFNDGLRSKDAQRAVESLRLKP